MIRINKDFIKDKIPEELILQCIKSHKKDLSRLIKNKEYYLGNHKILNTIKRENEPNNKIVNNFAKYITDIVSGYFIGNPITISSEDDKDITGILDTLEKLNANTHNADLEKDLSIYGIGYELLYINEDCKVKIAILSPENTFVVYSNEIGNKSLFAINYYTDFDINLKVQGYIINVYTDSEVLTYYSKDLRDLKLKQAEQHFFERVPVTQFFNNAEGKGDFEGVISQIDAYNVLMSDRINDKEKFVDSLLVVTGFTFEDIAEDANKRIKQSRIMEIPAENSDIKYITKSLNETEVQVLANSIKDDIHKFSQTPDFTDEKFSGNVSGVAMAYKLLALESLAKVKERFFIAGIKRRLKLINTILNKKSMNYYYVENIKITIVRTLPVNNLELAQMISLLNKNVSLETLIAQLPFVEDPVKELEKLKEEKQEDDESMAKTFNKLNYSNLGG